MKKTSNNSNNSNTNGDINNMTTFEYETSQTGKVGYGTRHASYFIVINEGAKVVGGDIKAFFDHLPKYVKANVTNVDFFAYNLEKNKKGNLHIHLYIELEGNGCRFRTMVNHFEGAHVELRRGSPKQALLYLEKPPNVTFGGEEKHHTVVIPVKTVGDFGPYELIQYRRKSPTSKMTTQEKFDFFLENCETKAEIKHMDLQFATVHKESLAEAFMEKALRDFQNSPDVITFTNPDGKKSYTVKRKVYYLWGTSRCGKTNGVIRKHGEEDVSIVGDLHRDMKYDDYRGTKVLVLDEFYSQLSLNQVLNITDDKIGHLPSRYQNKRNLTTTIVLTSNDPLYEQYPDEPESRRIPFLKRLTGGVWEVYRAAANRKEQDWPAANHTGKRIIACQIDGTGKQYFEDGFCPEEPPILIGGEVVLVPYEELLKIKECDKKKKKYTPPAEAASPEVEGSAEFDTLIGDLPF